MHYWGQTRPHEKTPSKAWAIAQAGLLFTELPKVWCQPEAAMAMKISGLEEMRAALAKGKGLIILTPHLGAFEMAARRFAREFPLTVLYRPARKQEIEHLVQSFRSAEGVRPVPANGQGVRELMRALRRGEAVGLLPDQVPSEGEGLVADFFGRPAYTMTLPIRLAQVAGAPLAWATALRTPLGWSLRLEPWEWEEAQEKKIPVSEHLGRIPLEQAVQLMNQELQMRIMRAPAQYLWAYDRFKRSGHA
jgi:KDO2-lipid IV(A) lauroyltransferase